jgi:hypothetical protein
VFTKITRTLIKHWRVDAGDHCLQLHQRSLGVRPLQEQALLISTQVQKDTQQAGFFMNKEKFHWELSTRTKWLGFVMDSATMKFCVSEKKLQVDVYPL